MIRDDGKGTADVVEALQEEIHALTVLDPYDPAIHMLQLRLEAALNDMYDTAPRGV